jgi:hypothetical protein
LPLFCGVFLLSFHLFFFWWLPTLLTPFLSSEYISYILWIFFISPSMMKGSIAGYINLGW